MLFKVNGIKIIWLKGIYVDLRIAFDCLDHQILLRKLSHYGIRGIPLEWFTSYLSNRRQFTHYNGTDSDMLPIVRGVRQGEYSRTAAFILFMNGIIKSSTSLHFVLYADDTNLFLSNKNFEVLMSQANAEMQRVTQWFLDNKLQV